MIILSTTLLCEDPAPLGAGLQRGDFWLICKANVLKKYLMVLEGAMVLAEAMVLDELFSRMMIKMIKDQGVSSVIAEYKINVDAITAQED
jgi:hypothetical protein